MEPTQRLSFSRCRGAQVFPSTCWWSVNHDEPCTSGRLPTSGPLPTLGRLPSTSSEDRPSADASRTVTSLPLHDLDICLTFRDVDGTLRYGSCDTGRLASSFNTCSSSRSPIWFAWGRAARHLSRSPLASCRCKACLAFFAWASLCRMA
jgi:hypothetical protein